MRKYLKYALTLVIGIAVGLSACLVAYYLTGNTLFEKTVGRIGGAETTAPADAENDELISYAWKILGYIKEGDYDALSKVVHPEYGARFFSLRHDHPLHPINASQRRRSPPSGMTTTSMCGGNMTAAAIPSS